MSTADPRSTATGCPFSARAAEFDPFEDAYQQDPPEYVRWAREQEPVFYSPKLGYWVVTRYDDVKAIGREVREKGFTAMKTNIFIYDNDKKNPKGWRPGFGAPNYPERNVDRHVLRNLRMHL
jgi:cytochrome P450